MPTFGGVRYVRPERHLSRARIGVSSMQPTRAWGFVLDAFSRAVRTRMSRSLWQLPPATSTPTEGGPGSPTGAPRSCSRPLPGTARCTSYAIAASPRRGQRQRRASGVERKAGVGGELPAVVGDERTVSRPSGARGVNTTAGRVSRDTRSSVRPATMLPSQPVRPDIGGPSMLPRSAIMSNPAAQRDRDLGELLAVDDQLRWAVVVAVGLSHRDRG